MMKLLVDKIRSDPTEDAMSALVQHTRGGQINDLDIAYLAKVLGKSGIVLSVGGTQSAIDLASTGGPTSLTTLLGPLYLRAMGCCVPKLGVPGRPAGSIDVLAQVPGYKVNMNRDEVLACIDRCGYAHFQANGEHAPLDDRLFKFRQLSGAQNIPELVIASLLSKKIAVGLQRAGLDVRVAPHGNLGGTWEEARRNARRFQNIASIIGMDAVCFLSDARFPYQPFVGRGESLVALEEIFSGTGNKSLEGHATQCFAMACATVEAIDCDLDGVITAAKAHFCDNLEAQGSSQDAFEEYVEQVRSGHKFEYAAKKNGFLSVRLDRLRDLVLRFQSAGAVDGTVFPDRMGLVLRKKAGDVVCLGDVLGTVRVEEQWWPAVERQLEDVFEISNMLECGPNFEKVMNG